jgi:hypothetical protein
MTAPTARRHRLPKAQIARQQFGVETSEMAGIVSKFLKQTAENDSYTVAHSESDIFRAAENLIERYRHDAGVQAALRMNEMLERGDSLGYQIWKRILAAIDERLSGGASDGTAGRPASEIDAI